MNEQELRVGNWVFLKSQNLKPYKIHSGSEITTGCDSDDFEPISLSNPVLDNYKDDDFMVLNGSHKLFIPQVNTYLSILYYPLSDKKEWIVVLEDIDENLITLPPIQYLHQLQNLVYVLTGKELEIDLSL